VPSVYQKKVCVPILLLTTLNILLVFLPVASGIRLALGIIIYMYMVLKDRDILLGFCMLCAIFHSYSVNVVIAHFKYAY
jgi:hypothetical protein